MKKMMRSLLLAAVMCGLGFMVPATAGADPVFGQPDPEVMCPEGKGCKCKKNCDKCKKKGGCKCKKGGCAKCKKAGCKCKKGGCKCKGGCKGGCDKCKKGGCGCKKGGCPKAKKGGCGCKKKAILK